MSDVKENRAELPSAKAKKLLEKAAEKEARQKQEEEIRGALARLSDTADGKTFLRWLKNECGWGNSYLALNGVTGTIDKELTVYQAIRLNLWWKVRRKLPIKQLIEVEHV